MFYFQSEFWAVTLILLKDIQVKTLWYCIDVNVNRHILLHFMRNITFMTYLLLSKASYLNEIQVKTSWYCINVNVNDWYILLILWEISLSWLASFCQRHLVSMKTHKSKVTSRIQFTDILIFHRCIWIKCNQDVTGGKWAIECLTNQSTLDICTQ